MVDTISTGKKWKKSSTILLILSFTYIICTGCITQEEPEGSEIAVAWEDYFRGDFAVTGEPVLNQEVKIVFSVNPVLDAPNTFINIYLSEGIELVEGDSTWEGDIKQDEPVQVTIVVRPIQEGQWDIISYVESVFSSKRKVENTYYLVFLTSKDSGQVSRTHFYPPPVEREGKLMGVSLILKSVPTPEAGEEVVLTFLVIASKDTSDVKAIIVLPEEFILIDGTLEWQGDLKEAQEETFQITIKTTEEGRFEIRGILTFDDEEWKYTYPVYVY
jgi:hypothetical protein